MVRGVSHADLASIQLLYVCFTHEIDGFSHADTTDLDVSSRSGGFHRIDYEVPIFARRGGLPVDFRAIGERLGVVLLGRQSMYSHSKCFFFEACGFYLFMLKADVVGAI